MTCVKIAVKALTKPAVEFAFSSPKSCIKLKHFERAAGDYDFGNTHASSLQPGALKVLEQIEPVAADAESKDDQNMP